jgi:DNA-binding LacI/PurR family transcriptional regulator
MVGPAADGERPRAPVMMDVARLAGVSHQTVSRVVNSHVNVRAETRQRVLDAMRQLNYQRNSAARTLVTRRSNTIGIITIDSTLFGPASMVYGIEQAARAAGYFVSVASINTLTQRAVREAVSRLEEQSVEGIVGVVPHDEAVHALVAVPSGVTTVAVGVGGGVAVPFVGNDNVAGAALATRHLLAQGHRTVHHIGGPVGYPDARERRSGWRKALTEACAPTPEPLTGDWSARSGYELGRVLAADRAVTAVFCGNDQMALGLLRALYEAGRQIPADVSVVGFDDVPEAAYMIPPLSTVKQDFAEMGRQSIDLFVRMIAQGWARPGGGIDPVRILLTPTLIPRVSSRSAA